VILLAEHICFQEDRITDIEERVRHVEINQAVANETLKNMNNNISEIKEFLKELPGKQFELQHEFWEVTMKNLIESAIICQQECNKPQNQESDNKKNPIIMELIKIIGIAIGAIVTLTGGIIIILKMMGQV
jgi:predicted nuclease with TOPRIM domain